MFATTTFHTIQYHITGDMQAPTSSHVGQSWLQHVTYVTNMLESSAGQYNFICYFFYMHSSYLI